MAEPFYITTAINYPNARPHVGHAYEAIATDAIARFQRMRGRDVLFQTGWPRPHASGVFSQPSSRRKCLAISVRWTRD